MAKKSKLLVLVDDSEHSRVAIRYACREAESLNFKVELLHVLDPREYNSLFMAGDAVREERHEEVNEMLKGMIKDVKDFTKIKPTKRIAEGRLSDAVVSVIEEDADINMLVLGKAPEEAGKKDLITMLSAELVGKIMIPMVIVPGNLTDKQIEDLT